MKNQNQQQQKDLNIDPVSRPSNEEIEENSTGNFSSAGEKYSDNDDHPLNKDLAAQQKTTKTAKSVAVDGPFSEDAAKGKNSLSDLDKGRED